jgi:pimeloyl-ACP methyl ester carboxylesterase
MVNPIPTRRCSTLRLKGGRRVCYTDTGPESGNPVIYCHGAIGTPVGASVDLERLTAELGVRYIAPLRPGIGGSDPDPGRTLVSYAQDIRELADALGLHNFSVVGVSAGGPYALALGYALRSRVARVAVCSSLTPAWPTQARAGLQLRARIGLALLERRPGFVTRAGDRIVPALASDPRLVRHMIGACSGKDGRHQGQQAALSFLNSVAVTGVGGLVSDYGVYGREWGFPVEEVYNQVQLWHGGGDPLVPLDDVLQLAALLPHCKIYVDPEQGHHFFRGSLEQILRALTASSHPDRKPRETTRSSG